MSPVTSRRRGRDEESIAAVADKGVEGEVAADDMETGMGGGVGGAASPALDFVPDPPPPPPVACDQDGCCFRFQGLHFCLVLFCDRFTIGGAVDPFGSRSFDECAHLH